jgi:ubiquinone/menaquinone biosynthesis C-methylase UbiE
VGDSFLAWWPDTLGALRELRRVLKLGGRLLCVVEFGRLRRALHAGWLPPTVCTDPAAFAQVS